MNTRLSTFLFAFLFLGASLGGYFFFAHLEQQTMREAQAVIQEIHELRATTAKVSALKNESAGLVADEALLASYFVRGEDIVPFLEYVERSGAPYSTLVNVASVSDMHESGTIALAVEIEGSFTGILKTLSALEYGKYALSAKSTTLEKGADGGWKLRGNFTALSYTP